MGVSQSLAVPATYFQLRSGPTIWIVGSTAFMAVTKAPTEAQ